MNDNNTQILPEMNSLWQETLNWQPTAEQQQQFQQLYQLILIGNEKLNLTRITSPEDFWEKHFWDSLRGIKFILENQINSQEEKKVIDIGTGAGFPGLPVAISLPQYTVTLLDSIRKKVDFIETILVDLAIKNCLTLTNRIEQIGRMFKHREIYDIALLRAVAPTIVCAEYALPMLKINGIAILYRGNFTTDEQANLLEVVKILGGKIHTIEEFKTPLTNSIRHCIYLQKVNKTSSNYPRPIGVPSQKPLNHLNKP
ncbi:MAG: 16S rRNA (guanine(527)-N(7))-methyltransferase RsmG [Okeania sp. SIO2G4]|uniref:16S rRNA (guanine(527)-N(7))-methyltransferase RsmG n=1 Tax=unclassified Okeania TaxID=2634635 RepID=UPI0013BD9381|nr:MULTISPECIES: 16S rRNA (guanine(527)-N(7))-methyltransferase RsmG [unclassified Okeania]NEP04474.1 16S rRNA (guanine(527)-N(7))-methyltransferase RsmG [Okeania sp. SIO4D6]NEP38389.1 16S rRNA (guanine(527)-N(7))-methyltransferase RsmG [Okeania sp. SIO2H7]NEP72807.1 16S rRNA (guanine(527)-N(7))-methyltransferase RsmG [Okeania sp. SIO2G5]NEP97161.1 16S rRNA (guanine(527)-N(7))-methyltransferase RsmG [Okeania sp. SIO2F5]NEQ94887.1 16S rRNA (guanine(527)-N(7))-methyltransferase RsmG [Okeania sp.